MNLQRFEKLRQRFEGTSFENNFTTINKILYYFSYLGNIFLILFSYFFLKTVTNAIPQLFPGQDIFFSIFIILFMTGYELFKRFAIEQLFQNLFLKKRGLTMLAGGLVCASLTVGSFYLSIKGSHRLIDDTKALAVQSDSLANGELDQLRTKYEADYKLVQSQIESNTSLINKTVDAGTQQNRILTRSEQNNITKWGLQVDKLKLERNKIDSTYQANKTAIEQRDYISDIDEATGQENDLAFYLLTIFLEILIIIGVGFNGYYNVMCFGEMKAIMSSTKYGRLRTNLALLKVYYNNGKKIAGDPCPSDGKFSTLAKLQGFNLDSKKVEDFIILLSQLEIVEMRSETNYGLAVPSARVYTMSYDQATEVLKSAIGESATYDQQEESIIEQTIPQQEPQELPAPPPAPRAPSML